jgi:choline kinase
VRQALVLAAGNGDRFLNGSLHSKLIEPVLGRPLILRTLDTAYEAGIRLFEVVLGYQAETLRELIERFAPPSAQVRFSLNPRWHLENGVSALAARERMAHTRFALLMGDHLFEPEVLIRLLRHEAVDNESILAIDSRPAPAAVVAEATQVRMDGPRIVAIGKDLAAFDALDTGVFVCAPSLFDALTLAQSEGDTTLTGGIRRLASQGLMRGVDIGDARWFDIDTLADLEAAESLLAAQPEHA